MVVFQWLKLPCRNLSEEDELSSRRPRPGILNIAYDILIYSVSKPNKEAEMKPRLCLLHRSNEKEIALNPDKLKLKMGEVEFTRHVLGGNSVAIVKMPISTTIEESEWFRKLSV